jgi:anaerobic magnesium-protoporphyrin IX monomethyl ester cyclase
LKDIYELLFGFAETNYPDDSVLKQLITLDYYAYYKVKPQTLFWEELPRNEKYALLDSLKLNHNKFRFVTLPLTFDFELFEKENRIEESDCTVIFKYDGLEKAVMQVVNVLVEA